MSAITDALRAIAANPDDLTQLPHLIAQIDAIEAKEYDYQTRIKSLQDTNYAYLQQIPSKGNEPPKVPEPEPEATLQDARDVFISLMGGNQS